MFATVAVQSPAYAQEITASVDGQVSGPGGTPIPNASVTITDNRTNASQTYTTGADGRFSARNLTPGGPYTITATAPGYQGQTVENLITTVAGTTTLSFDLSAESASVDANTIVVTAQRANVELRAIGPGTAFGEDTLEGLPSINRDVRDIVRVDPRVSLERENEVDRVSCLGANDRANTFTVDGIVQADVFGLNGTPFAARNALPIPFDAIRETSVEFSPFDVEYGQFTGCAINVVTKSGSNAIHGSAFYVFNNQRFTGSKVDGDEIEVLPFKDTNWGLTLGGPIIRDRLFVFYGYENVRDQDSQEAGPLGGGFPNEEEYITVAQAEEIGQVLQEVYGINPGPIAQQLNETNRRHFGRVDAVISDNHRVELTHQRLNERNVEPDDFFGGDQFTALNAFEEEGTNSKYTSGRLYSQWTDNFSTELRLSRAKVADVQGPVGGGEAQSGNPTPRIVVGVQNDGNEGLYLAGPGQFRSANQLDTKVDQLKLKGELDLGGHVVTVGTEVNRLDVLNLFIVNATGTLVFQDIDALREGILTSGSSTFLDPGDVLEGDHAGAFGSFTESGDPLQAAAAFKRTIYSAYLQDDWTVNDQLNLLGGVRLEWYDGDAPRHNPAFEARYGFSNATKFDALGLTVLPRLGATYDIGDRGWLSRPQLKGGIGWFAGGDPTVWFSNAFSNNGFASGFGSITSSRCNDVPLDVVQNGQFTGFPQCVREAAGAQAAQGLNDTQSTDPDIKLPTVRRINVGFSTRLNFGGGSSGLFDGWRLNLDYIHSRYNNPYEFVDLSQTIDARRGLSGFTIDGRPIYRAIDPTATGCTAELVGTGGTPPQYTNVNDACFATGRDDEIQLTNADDFTSQVASIILGKRFPGGVFGGDGSTNLTLGYAFTDSNNRRDHISAQSTSNFDASALLDRQNPGVATSGFETRHNFTAGLNFRQEIFKDLFTQFGMFFGARSGRPYSYTFDGSGVMMDSASGSDNVPLYVPTGPGDPNIVYVNTISFGQVVQTAAQTEERFNEYISQNRCLNRDRGGAARRNGCRNDWYYDLDLRLSQELPGIFGGQRAKIFMDFDNFLNFVDDKWNLFRSRPALVDVVDLVTIDSAGRYVVRDFNPDDDNDVRLSPSLWRIQIGARYEF